MDPRMVIVEGDINQVAAPNVLVLFLMRGMLESDFSRRLRIACSAIVGISWPYDRVRMICSQVCSVGPVRKTDIPGKPC